MVFERPVLLSVRETLIAFKRPVVVVWLMCSRLNVRMDQKKIRRWPMVLGSARRRRNLPAPLPTSEKLDKSDDTAKTSDLSKFMVAI